MFSDRYYEVSRTIRGINLRELTNHLCKVSFTRVLKTDYIPSPRNLVSHDSSFTKTQTNVEILFDDTGYFKTKIKDNRYIVILIFIVCLVILYILT